MTKSNCVNNVYLLLGSNIDRERNLPEAVRLLAESVELVAVSPVYETAPVGLTEQPAFFNAAAHIRTPLSPPQIKQAIIHPIEQTLKRVRQADKNAPRTIDLDIILFNNAVLDYNHHHIPDPDLLRFAHVAVPLANLAPTLRHPETDEPLMDIAQRLLAAAAIPLISHPEVSLPHPQPGQ